MAKKTQKAKPAKKAAKSAKPAKKAVVKKPAKKAAPKKAVKKAIAKKIIKKTLPKKAAKPAKAPAKKAVAKKVVAKKVIKKAVKPVKKAATKKPVAKKPVPKKIIKTPLVKNMAKPVKKVVAKKVEKPTKKAVEKPVAKEEKQKPVVKQQPEPKKEIEKPVVVAKPAEAPVRKPEPVSKKKQRDMDDDNSRDEAPMVVEYKTPSIRKPMGPAPKPHINTDTRTRYSDAELKEFKELILKKLAEAQKDFELLKSTLSHKDDHGTDDTSPTFKLLEDGSDVLSKEETAHLASRQEKFIQNLQNALIRIENKTYGICRATGKLISKERLRSVPHATLAIEAKLEQNV
jgi:RNA polymerase-binding transcription factor DksA